jgi:hypothetical protein
MLGKNTSKSIQKFNKKIQSKSQEKDWRNLIYLSRFISFHFRNKQLFLMFFSAGGGKIQLALKYIFRTIFSELLEA